MGIDHIDVLKVDTEGHDLEVIDGAAPLLERGAISIIVLEYGFGANRLRSLDEELRRLSPHFTLLMTFDPFIYDGVIDHANALFVRRDLIVRSEPAAHTSG